MFGRRVDVLAGKMVEITGDIDFADHLERIAFNALPAQISDDFMTKQYFQQPNQVMVTRHVATSTRIMKGQTLLLAL